MPSFYNALLQNQSSLCLLSIMQYYRINSEWACLYHIITKSILCMTPVYRALLKNQSPTCLLSTLYYLRINPPYACYLYRNFTESILYVVAVYTALLNNQSPTCLLSTLYQSSLCLLSVSCFYRINPLHGCCL